MERGTIKMFRLLCAPNHCREGQSDVLISGVLLLFLVREIVSHMGVLNISTATACGVLSSDQSPPAVREFVCAAMSLCNCESENVSKSSTSAMSMSHSSPIINTFPGVRFPMGERSCRQGSTCHASCTHDVDSDDPIPNRWL